MAKTKKFRKPSKREMDKDYLKANRKGNRDAEIENECGWVGKNKVHKNKKAYIGKPKYKENWD